MEAKASAKYLRGSAQKARLVIDMIRGKNVNQALAVLQFTNKRAADGIEACVRSAIANATEAAEKANIAVDPDELWVKEAYVDQGPTKGRRRMRPAPQGRAYREQRHYCHVTVLLSSDEMLTRAAASGKNAKAAAGNGKARPARTTQATTKVRDRRSQETATEAETKESAAQETTPVTASTIEENTTVATPLAGDDATTVETNAAVETSAVTDAHASDETNKTAKE